MTRSAGAYQGVFVVVGESAFNGVKDGAITDDFSGDTLSPFWTYVDPLADTTLSMTGAELSISIPEGVDHSMWTGIDTAPRLIQPVGDNDLDVVVKFESLPQQRWQGQGLIFMEDDLNWVRFTADHNGSKARVVAHKMVDGVAQLLEAQEPAGRLDAVPAGDPHRRRLDLPTVLQRHEVVRHAIRPRGAPRPCLRRDHGDHVERQRGPGYNSIVDYFESKTTGGLNDDAPQITDVQVDATSRHATVSWTTNVRPTRCSTGGRPSDSTTGRTTSIRSFSTRSGSTSCDAMRPTSSARRRRARSARRSATS